VDKNTAEDLWALSGTSPPEIIENIQGQVETGHQILISVHEAAKFLNVSESWIRRHISELPAIRIGHHIRFDSSLLVRNFRGKYSPGNRLKTGGEQMSLQLRRYQRGSVFTRGKSKVWYGMFREDIRTAEGMKRRQRMVRLGAFSEVPTKSSARNRLAEFLSTSHAKESVEMEFIELANRWKKAEGPALKRTTLGHYSNALRAYVLPEFGKRKIASITREDIQIFLADKARTYSTSTLRSIRAVLGLVLGWAEACGWIAKNPCTKVKLPRHAGGRRIARTVLAAGQLRSLVEKLEEPYATLVLFLAATGVRIGEAIAVKWLDFSDNAVRVSRRIYDGEVDSVKSLKSVRTLPLDPQLVCRIEKSGAGHEWVFRSRTGTSLNPGNVLKRHVRPAADSLGFTIGGWHDFRHTLSTELRRTGVHPKVVSDILGHSRVALAMDVYDRTDLSDLQPPLMAVSKQLLSSVIKSGLAA